EGSEIIEQIKNNSMAFADLRRSFFTPARLNVSFDDGFELLRDIGAPQSRDLLPVYIDSSRGKLAGPRQRDADVGMFRFAWTIDDAAHDRKLQRFEPRIILSPVAHPLAHIGLDVLSEFLEDCRGGAPTARAGNDHGRERTQAHGLQDLLRHGDLTRTVAARLWGERDANGVADTFLQKD